MRTFVFAGPSLSAAQARAIRPDALLQPPIAHGDLLRLAPSPGDRVLIIDGLFLQAAPVRHREILDLLDRGVVVAGASSMGALRAAELWQFGMRGVGEIFRMYRDGEVDGDDEVAMTYGPDSTALSEPLVNIRLAVRAAVAAGAVPGPTGDTLVAAARSLPFRMRSYRGLRHVAGDVAEPFLAWLADHPVDAKVADARELLRSADTLTPRDGTEWPIQHVHTSYFTGWQARNGGTDVDGRWVSGYAATTALMLLHPDYPACHRRAVLALADSGAGSTGGPIDGQVAGDLPEPSWLTPAERDLPADEAARRVTVRALGTVENRCVDYRAWPAELDTDAVRTAVHRVVTTAEQLNEAMPRTDPLRPHRRMRFRRPVIDRWYAELWHCHPDDLEAHVWDRGFVDLHHFRIAAEPFVAYLKAFGRPELPAAA
jgi:hypothetical protein